MLNLLSWLDMVLLLLLNLIDYGIEKRVSCDFASSEDVEKHVSDLVIQAEQINSMANKI